MWPSIHQFSLHWRRKNLSACLRVESASQTSFSKTPVPKRAENATPTSKWNESPPFEDGLDVFFYRLFINQAITHILGPFQAIKFSTIVLGIKLVVPSNACHNKHITILNHQQMNDMNVNKFSLLLMFHRVNTKLRGNRIKSFFTQIRTCWA